MGPWAQTLFLCCTAAAVSAFFTALWIWPLRKKTPNGSRAALAHLAENLTDGFWEWDLATGLVRFSDSYARTLGYAKLKQGEDLWSDLIHPDDRRGAEVALQRHLTIGEPYERVLRMRAADGSYQWHLERAQAVLDDNGEPASVIGFHMDITPTKHTEDVLRRTNSDLEQFAYSASHDLQEPLRMIGGWVSALFEDYGDRLTEPDAIEAKHYIVEGVQRMHRLIDDLLRFSRAGRNLSREHFPLIQSVNEVVSSLAMAIADAEAEIEAVALPPVYGDAGTVTQVLQNLVSNSLKYRHSERKCRVRITAEEQGGVVWVHVADNGIGIPEEYRERVFEVFTRLYARDRYNGTGIGLALVRRIVHAHGGQVTISSGGEGTGTTVSFSLPPEPSSAPEEATSPEEGKRDA